MRGAVGNIFKKHLTSSLSTLAPSSNLSSFVKDGWEFSARNCDASDRLKDSHLRFRGYSIYDSEFCIKHLNIGIKFNFNAYDALTKSDQERRNGDPLKNSTLPSYASPFLPLISRQCDSAYVGNISIEKPSEKPNNINPNWDSIDSKTLDEQLLWLSKNEQISTVPTKYTHFDGPAFFVTNRKEVKKTDGLLSPLVNLEMPLYVDFDVQEDEKSSCTFSLVVTDSGWFVLLNQLFCSYFGDTRERMMTMHCNFKQDIVCREIVEQQTEDFERTVPSLEGSKSNWWKESCPESYPHFHEVKQLRIQEPAFMRGIDHGDVKYKSIEWKKAYLQKWNVSIHEIKSLMRKGCQVVPLFLHPYNPVAFLRYRSLGTVRNSYDHGHWIRNYFEVIRHRETYW